MSCMLPVDKFVAYIIDKTDMLNIYYSMPGGEVRAENLMLLMNFLELITIFYHKQKIIQYTVIEGVLKKLEHIII